MTMTRNHNGQDPAPTAAHGQSLTREAETRALFEPLDPGTRFSFGCHPGIACFTACCAKLRLVLTPYDILRLKEHLGLSSEIFLETYTETFVDRGARFPLVKLRMREDEGGLCPFVTPRGCTVYQHRPSACRLYPVGRASLAFSDKQSAKERYFLVKEPHCQGFQEEQLWDLGEWLAHEGLTHYNDINDAWLQILTSPKSLGDPSATQQKLQMFFMASYNLDRFRNFVFQSRFLKLFEVDRSTLERIGSEDEALLHFGFLWLRFSLFGEETLAQRDHAGE